MSNSQVLSGLEMMGRGEAVSGLALLHILGMIGCGAEILPCRKGGGWVVLGLGILHCRFVKDHIYGPAVRTLLFLCVSPALCKGHTCKLASV